MPSFYVDEMDIDVGEFLDACSKKEITELVEYLIEDGYLSPKSVVGKQEPKSMLEQEWDEVVDKIQENRLMLTAEEEEIIRKIAKRF